MSDSISAYNQMQNQDFMMRALSGATPLQNMSNLAINQSQLALGNSLPLVGQTVTADQAIQNFQQMTGVQLTDGNSFNPTAAGMNFTNANMAYNLGGGMMNGYSNGFMAPINFGSTGCCVSQKDAKFMRNVGIFGMVAQALGSIAGNVGINGAQTNQGLTQEGVGINSSNPIQSLFNQLSQQAMLPNESGGIIDVAKDGLPFVQTGLTGAIDNAVSCLEKDGKATDDIKAQYKSSQEIETKVGKQIEILTEDLKKLSPQKKELAKLEDKTQEMYNKGLTPEQQAKVDKFNMAAAKYADAKNLAEKFKADYELTPDKITNEDGKQVDNPHKAEIKKQWQDYEKQAKELLAEREKIRKEISGDSKVKECSQNFQKLFDFAGEYELKKANKNSLKQYQETLSEKNESLGELIDKKSKKPENTDKKDE